MDVGSMTETTQAEQLGALQWIETARLVPFSRNVRTQQIDEDVDSIAQSMREKGYLPEKPMLVRPLGNGFEIIGGHTRFAAAKRAGIERVLCAVCDLDDEEATLRNASDNVATPPPWYDLCLYVRRNAVKDSKKGLSRTALTAAATGKADKTARNVGNLLFDAGEVLAQCPADGTLLPTDRNLTQHLAAIHALPESCWPAAVQIMLDRQWSVKDTKHWVDLAREFVIPDKWQSIFLPLADVVARFLETREFSAQTVKRLINEAERVELMLLDNKQPTDEWFAWLAENKGADAWDVRLVSQRGRELENEIEDANKDVVAWHLGNWRDHVDALDDGSVSAIVTDPPYGVDFQSDHRLDRRKEHKHDRIENDGDLQAAADEMQSAFSALAPKLKADASVFVFCSWKNEFETRAAVEAAGFLVRNSIVWVKNRTGMGDPNTTFAPKHERIIFAVKGSPKLSERLPDVLEADRPDSSRHPTEKPADLLSQLIGVTTVQGDLVVDPFGGVASTVVAALESGRRGWGCEISAEYHAAGAERLK